MEMKSKLKCGAQPEGLERGSLYRSQDRGKGNNRVRINTALGGHMRGRTI